MHADFLLDSKQLLDIERKAMKGVRKLDPARVGRWKDKKRNKNYIFKLAKKRPKLNELLNRDGYEENKDWYEK